MRKCLVCQKEFIPKRKNGQYCSEKCRNIGYNRGYKFKQTEAYLRARAIVKEQGGIGI